MLGLSPGALDGVRIIDLSRVLGGPFCTQMLGDHGADVIKVESAAGDETREWGPPFRDGLSAYYAGVNRNKRGIVLDLASDAGRDTLLDLLADADVLVENFKTGTLEKWGLGHDDVLSQRFPRLVHCRITGYGDDGPFGGLPGYDAAVQARSGLISINGEADRDPVRIGIPIVDLATGFNAALGIVMALFERERSGQGQLVDVTLYDSAISVLHPHMANHLMSGNVPVRMGSAHPNITPYDVFATGTGPVFLAVGNDRQFAAACAVLGQPSLAEDPRFVTNALRTQNRLALTEAFASLFAVRDRDEVVARFAEAGIPCAPVADIAEVAAHPHTAHRGMIADADGIRAPGPPVKLSRTPASIRRRPPQLGEHTDEVLSEVRAHAADEEE